MKNMTLRNIAAASGGTYIGDEKLADEEITGVVKDNREVAPGNLFVPFAGARVDGHMFISDAFKRGAICCLSEHELNDPDGAYILVKSTAKALMDIAGFYRKQIGAKIIGVTGSVGKTSAKEFIAGVLSVKFNVLKTEGNFNNEIGMPLTILKIRDDHDVAVIEMGISDFGEMSRLANVAGPDVCVITNIGTCHLENLGDRDGVFRAKTEIFEYVNENDAVILNGDDDKLAGVKDVNGIRPVFYGFGENADVRACGISSRGIDSSDAVIKTRDGQISVNVPAAGEHMVLNALAGAACGLEFGMTLPQIKEGIESQRTIGGRLNVIRTEKLTIIDDCYNASPASVKAALKVLALAEGRRIAIIGGMNELGEKSAAFHRQVGEYAGTSGIDVLACVGKQTIPMAKAAAAAAAASGNDMQVLTFTKKEEVILLAARGAKKGDTVLVKASHSFGFDEIVEKLKSL